MPLTETELETEIDRINTLIQSITANPKPTYQVDGVRMEYTALLKALMEYRTQLKRELSQEPFVAFSVIEFADE
jgi:hypothetical protein